MQHLNGSYTGYYNRRHRRSGHLLQGRFKAHLIEDEGHYWEISRYIHLNPVRARMVAHPKDWPWSSYRGYHRAAWQLDWVIYNRVLGEFGDDPVLARRAYRRFVSQGALSLPPSPWRHAVEGLIVGGERFVDKVRAMLAGRSPDPSLPTLEALRRRPSLEHIASEVARAFRSDRSRWSVGRRCDDVGRGVAAYLARYRYGYRTNQIARVLGYRTHGGVVAAVRRVASADDSLAAKVFRLEEKLVTI